MADIISEYIKSVGADREPDMRPGDYRNEQGLIVCGKCGISRQKILKLPFGDKETIVHCTCLCEQEDMRKRAEQERKRRLRVKYIQIMEESAEKRRIQEKEALLYFQSQHLKQDLFR